MSVLGVGGKAYEAYKTISSLGDTDAAKQKVIQAVAFMIVANALYNTSKARVSQATVNLTAGAVLWMNQEAFLHKALSANVQDFGTENDRLKDLVGQFEQIGLNLKDLTTSEREQLHAQMSKFNDLFQALTVTVAESSRKLSASVDAKTSKVSDARITILALMESVTRSLEAVDTKEQLGTLTLQVETIARIAQQLVEVH